MSFQSEQFYPGAKTFLLPCTHGVLEVSTDSPDKHLQPITAIICHPHPLHGGTMDNKVVTTCMRALRDMGLKVVRFNFRGVGKSTGTHDKGRAETDDLMTVLAWVRHVAPQDRIWLAGFSFGAHVAAKGASLYAPTERLISIAPAVTNQDFTSLTHLSLPWLVVIGEEDEIISPEAVYAWASTMPENLRLIRVPETGHFFNSRLLELRAILQTHLTLHHDTT